MAKTKKTRTDAAPKPSAPAASAPGGSQFVAIRETIESIVVAFALAFFIRTFEAEAFVIPTGSMSPSLLGMHKDGHCPECGYRYRASASNEDVDELMRRAAHSGRAPNPRDFQVVAGMCPMCRYVAPLRNDISPATLKAQGVSEEEIVPWGTYSGDRILVNKFGTDYREPKRWDVMVFKYPGDGNMNYIKRLVGLPNEQIRVQYGDLFVAPTGAGADEFALEAKPGKTVASMLQPVHDTDYEPATLYNAGWPLRWAATTRDGWEIEASDDDGANVRQSFHIEANEGDEELAWIRYRHLLPDGVVWDASRDLEGFAAENGVTVEQTRQTIGDLVFPQLITDFNPYNAYLERREVPRGGRLAMFQVRQGPNWVGDLAVEADIASADAQGELVLDLVEAGLHFYCTIDLSSGQARLSIVDGRTGESLDFEKTFDTPVSGGEHQVRFANVDDQLLLWVDDMLTPLAVHRYDPDQLVAGGRKAMIPWTSPGDSGDQGDLSPVGIGTRGANVTISRLAVFRDIYYIATNHTFPNDTITFDYEKWTSPVQLPSGEVVPRAARLVELMSQPELWPRFLTRRTVQFETAEDQFFVMGDNSPASKDCRLWMDPSFPSEGIPGGNYVHRDLLIGKAVAVFWPHSWGSIPGLRFMPGWPNFGDMRMVR